MSLVKRNVVLLLLAVIQAVGAPVFADKIAPGKLAVGLIDRIDNHIENGDRLIEKRKAYIDSIKGFLITDSPSAKVERYRQLGALYSGLNVDSAVSYFDKGIESARALGDNESRGLLLSYRSALYPIMGVTKEAIEDFISADSLVSTPEGRLSYFRSGVNLYKIIASSYTAPALRRRYEQSERQMIDSLMKYLPDSVAEGMYYRAEQFRLDNKPSLMIAVLKDAMEASPSVGDPVYGMCALMLGEVYSETGMTDEAVYYLGLAAVNDVYNARYTGHALQQLGNLLYARGDVARGYRYMTVSLDNAVMSDSRLRALQTVENIPVISRAFREQDNRKFRWVVVLVIALGVALIVIAIFAVTIMREIRKLKIMREQLAEANHKKDTHISQFLNLSSIYMDKLEEFTRIAKRKISAGQIDDLFNLIKSGKMIDEQSKVFFEIFDNAFINIYPTFVDDVNKLLRPDKRIVVASPGQLNTELRILAFMRLGIEDTNRVAGFMGLSINTIYTYRNKIRGKALDRETFEAEVMNIGRLK